MIEPQRTQRAQSLDEGGDLTEQVIGACIEVHRHLGPGLLESAYEACLAHELSARGICFERQVDVAVTYKDQLVDCGFRADLIVDGRLIVELKAIEGIKPIHKAQVLTYLKLTGIPLALLINFNTTRLVDGVQRLALSGGEINRRERRGPQR